MNGIVTGEIVMNAAIYQREVCEVCLKCKRARCENTDDGCMAYRAAVREYCRRNRKTAHGRRSKGAVKG